MRCHLNAIGLIAGENLFINHIFCVMSNHMGVSLKILGSLINIFRILVKILAEKPFICTNCGKGFKREGDLREHLTTKKNPCMKKGSTPFQCPNCGKTFKGSENLYKHMKNTKCDKQENTLVESVVQNISYQNQMMANQIHQLIPNLSDSLMLNFPADVSDEQQRKAQTHLHFNYSQKLRQHSNHPNSKQTSSHRTLLPIPKSEEYSGAKNLLEQEKVKQEEKRQVFWQHHPSEEFRNFF